MKNRERKYLDFMGAYWSCSPDAFEKIQYTFEKSGVVNLYGLDVVQIKRKPRGEIYKFSSGPKSE